MTVIYRALFHVLYTRANDLEFRNFRRLRRVVDIVSHR